MTFIGHMSVATGALNTDRSLDSILDLLRHGRRFMIYMDTFALKTSDWLA